MTLHSDNAYAYSFSSRAERLWAQGGAKPIIRAVMNMHMYMSRQCSFSDQRTRYRKFQIARYQACWCCASAFFFRFVSAEPFRRFPVASFRVVMLTVSIMAPCAPARRELKYQIPHIPRTTREHDTPDADETVADDTSRIQLCLSSRASRLARACNRHIRTTTRPLAAFHYCSRTMNLRAHAPTRYPCLHV